MAQKTIFSNPINQRHEKIALINRALGTGPLAPNMQPPDGIGFLDPRIHASAEAGRRNVELCAAAIGRKAKELLETLPENQRSFNKSCICPEQWWSI